MPPRRPIYLDHQSTTPVDPRVFEAMQPYFLDDFGNAASKSHVFGWRAEAAVEEARERVAATIGARPREILFTSGATESNNLAILGAARTRRPGRTGVVTLATEHHAVLDAARHLEQEGATLHVVGVGPDGYVDVEALGAHIDANTAVVSVMAANNEIGVLQPLREIAAICREQGAWFHSDAAQAVGKVPLDVDESGVDLLSISGHKIYGPKGIGALFARASRPRVRLEPLQYGGGHERGMRSGTLAVPLIVGLARALEIAVAERDEESKRLRVLRDRLWRGLSHGVDGLRLNSDLARGLPGNLNVSFEGVDGEKLLLALPDVAVSTGSACTSALPEPSHVLAAIGLSEALGRASLRFGLGRDTSEEEVDLAVQRVVDAVQEARAEAR